MGKLSTTTNMDLTDNPGAVELAAYCETLLRNIGWYAPVASHNGSAHPAIGSLVFAGPSAGQGVTTLATTTAMVAAQDGVSRILVLDCSNDRAAQRMLGCGPTGCDLNIWLAKYIRNTRFENLHVLSLAEATKLRHPRRMTEAGRQLAQCFDLIVIDLPAGYRDRWRPVLLGQAKLGLVVANQFTPRHQVTRLAEQLKHEGVAQVGVVLNMEQPAP